MKNKYNYFYKSIAFILSFLVLMEAFCLPVFAEEINSSINNIQKESNIENDSKFILSNSNVEISDDYLPESTYVSEIEATEWQPENEHSEMPEGIVSRSTVGDPMVYLTQKWLNQEYGNVPGFGSVPENGRTGWDTVYGLTRALQVELGITSLANNFGPTTEKLYSQNPLHRQDGVTNRKFAILQGALWCKGYSPGYYLRENSDGTVTFEEIFNEDVEKAVIQLKKDAGFINPDGVVTTNVMKALMSMDAFKLLSSYGGDAKVRSMQQKLNRKYEAYTGLTPCDGVYGRNTNKAIIYALQAEEGLPISVANGNFGNTTKKCCPQIPYIRDASAAKNYYNSYYSSNTISAMTELIQFALYVNGFGDGVTDGIWDSGVQQALRSFQKKYAIPQTGIADKTTWLSLFISCGDTDRSAKAADCATQLSAAQAKALYDNGYRYIGRYLTGTYNGGKDKSIKREEAQRIFDAGLNFFPIYQTSARSNAYFTEAQGKYDAQEAIKAAANLGIPRNTIIYFAVDFDCMDSEITSNIIPYFRAVHETMVGSIYRTGIYGTRNACTRVSNMGYACSSFVGDMSTGFSGNLGFSMPNNWAFDQFHTTTIGSGTGYLEIDKDGFSGRDYGVSKLDAPKTNTELPDITFGKAFGTDIVGPIVDILGTKTPLFKTPFGLDVVLSDAIDADYDVKKNTYNVTIGLLESQRDPSLKNKNYAEIKEMIQFFGGHTTTATWNKYQKLRSKLKKLPFDLGFSFNGSFAGYMEIDANTGNVREGGLLIVADASVSTEIPIYPPVILEFKISGSLQGTLKFTQVNENTYAPSGLLEFSVQLKGTIGLEVLIANAFVGASGNIKCSVDSFTDPFSESFKAQLDLRAHLELGFLLWGKSFEWKFAEWNLYPGDKKNQAAVYSISKDDLEFIEPLSPINVYSNDPNVYKANVQTYCSPQIISLGSNKMLMTYIDDLPDRSAENRTTLMYSIYDGENWSTPVPVLNDGTVDYEPVMCSDGNGGVHILWQNSKKIFNSDVTMEEMSKNMELYYTHWNGNTFENTIALTDNNNYEMGYKIISDGNNLSVIWQQNSENDPFTINGTNTIYRRQCKNGTWENTEVIASDLNIVTSMDTSYVNGNNVVAFTAKSNTDLSTTNDLELYYYDGTLIRLTNDNLADYSACFIDNELYWINNSSVLSISDGNINSKKTVIENIGNSIANIKALKNSNGQKVIVWEQSDNDLVKLYGSFYNKANGEFGVSVPLSSGEEVLRNWDACMLPDGNLEFAYCAADLLDETIDGKTYGQLDLIQKSSEEFFDVSIGQMVTYSGEVLPDNEITLLAELYNLGSKDVTQFDINIIDANGNVVYTDSIDKSLSVGNKSTIEIPFSLPSTISKSEYNLKIIPHGGEDIDKTNNEAVFTIGYADLAIKEYTETRTNNGRQLDIAIINQGYTSADGTFEILGEESEEPVFSGNISQLDPGEVINFTYIIDNSQLDSTASEEPILFNMKIESTSEEDNYQNNTQEVYIYPDYTVEINSGVGGTVTGSGKYIYNSTVTVKAIPDPGYIFAGWYENGKLLDNLTNEYSFEILENRSLEAKFIPNNLNITDIKIFGDLKSNNNLAFTICASGGTDPYNWEYLIYKDDELCYDSKSSLSFFEWVPREAGNYLIVVNVTDSSDFKVSSTKEFTVL